MSDCDKLHPAFRNLETIEEAHRRRLSPSLVEAVAMAVVLLLLLATNFDRWTGSANAPSKVAVIHENALELDDCRAAFLPGDC
ncbi:hypothetical protein ACI2KT_31760 [Ensifer adhaerens]|uniref:Uncharacterized protein n=1 Tax=Ensifer adhaerens TaxID=106592 RepID=A0ABY8HTG3_ENSAD|nr:MULTISPECIES: hypothetical protein [Ensifer]KSV66191.1 hypothetical protein N185_33030 [Sinorhizobium sp. GW3]ANK76659.1 hypothetical protein FA04_28450 [Ensifer adhaerens]KDP72641.1 hypothetical protein FA04_16350 [Ensifer adhaerens]KQX24918.1 hypothetical protein ASD01_26415 [Ensifer sp. Root423]KQZ58771.1 hypothetical protein ASD63_04635 [Ensifer sp. Root558]